MFFFVILISSVGGANILCSVLIPGSHFFLTKAVADLLLDEGHNVTFLSTTNETRIKLDERMTYIAPPAGGKQGYPTIEDYFESVGNLISAEVLKQPSATMAMDHIMYGDNWTFQGDQLAAGYEFFIASKEVKDLLESVMFDLIIAEQMALEAIAAATYKQSIPIVALYATSDMRFARERQHLPMLLTSEPSFQFPIPAKAVPTFRQRCQALWDLAVFVKNMYIDFVLMVEEKYLSPEGISSYNGVYEHVEMSFMNDHPALSFPYLAPPNTVYMGSFHLKEGDQLKPLPKKFTDFIDNCSRPHIIYISFGTYLRDMTKLYWINIFLEFLQSLDACIIFKVPSENRIEGDRLLPNDKFLVETWVPQVELLGSKKVTMFISHCGNNGRLEAIFYNVPILCIPLFADQLGNGFLVERKEFGKILLKEDVTIESLEDAVQETIAKKDIFSANMKRAMEIVKTDPGVGKASMLFHINQLIKEGNANYLRNRIIEQQGLHETYNLDIIFIFVTVAFFVLTMIAWLVVKIFKGLMKYLLKMKTE